MKVGVQHRSSRDYGQRFRRAVLAAFALHAAFVGAVLLVDNISSTITLRNLHEQIVDRHAYEAWWSLHRRFPHEIGTLMYPAARSIGLENTSSLVWIVWYLIVGALPYVALAGIVTAFPRRREKMRLGVLAPTQASETAFGAGDAASMSRAEMPNQPNAMEVQFGLFRNDDLLCRGRVRIEEVEKSEAFDYQLTSSDDTPNVQPAGRMVLRHRFSLPAASLELKLVHFTAHDAPPKIPLDAALKMGVHTSEDWESVALGAEYSLAFLCCEQFTSIKA